MLYRSLGRTGLKVSQLGFGAMRLPMVGDGDQARINRELAIPMIHRAFEGGVNYIDSAVGYCNKDSQRVVGEAVKSWRGGRDSIIISTKNHYYGDNEKEWWQNLEDSLERLQVSCIDIYNHHGMGWGSYRDCVEPRLSKWMLKARQQGLIKHICNSFHDNNDALKKIVDTGYTSSVTLQYNMLDRQLEEGIAYAHSKGVGIVVMGPVAGGRLGSDMPALKEKIPNLRRIPEVALRFVLANPNVSVALSGMSTMQQVEENVQVASDGKVMGADEMRLIGEQLDRLKKMADLYCTGCNYCKPCPNKVDIPQVFQRYNVGRVYGMWDQARGGYQWQLKHGSAADQCVECGECEPKCPQNLKIREQLKESHAALTAAQ
jgi:predicted aldo/keto reductase-like oxidoreductase